MTKQVEAETLREWLDTERPVTVLDIRTDDDRAQWAIPGSLHINAYEALRRGQPGALADVPLPSDRPVVTICDAGRVSQTVADVLTARGFDARLLAGGMKAWSLAWNAADVPLPDSTVRVIQVRRTGKGCLSSSRSPSATGGQSATYSTRMSMRTICRARGPLPRTREPRSCYLHSNA